MKDDLDFYICTEYNPYDGFYHLTLRFASLEENYTKKEFIEGVVKAVNRNWKTINLFLKEGNLPKKRRRKNLHFSSLKWKVFKRDDFTCRKCGSQEFLELDHEEGNYQTLCKKCNVRKKDKLNA